MKEKPTSAALVFWIIWFAILNGLFILLFLAAGGIPKGVNEGEAPWGVVVVAGMLAAVSMAIRFLHIPRISEPAKLLPAMIVGLAMAEGIGIIGMFLVGKELPQTRLALFFTAVSVVVVYAPFYVHQLAGRRKMR
jgi:hypothetical protein